MLRAQYCFKEPLDKPRRLPDDAQVTDLTASLLKLMGRTVPPHIEGRSWW
ncbi:MAG: hypothetical protein Q8L89_06745 [Gammaproteobacteria bacterium]|nr:hypothetical protein [Gammaproteobacteria bacterium]